MLYSMRDSCLACETVDSMTALVEFLANEVQQSSLRAVEAKTGVSRGALEKILNGTTKRIDVETLQRIANAYHLRLWQVMHMAGIDLELPQTPTERANRLAAVVEQSPVFASLVDQLQELYQTDPDFVDGVLLSMEAMLRQHRKTIDELDQASDK